MFKGVNIQPYLQQLRSEDYSVRGLAQILHTSDFVGELQLDVGKHVGLVVAGADNQPGLSIALLISPLNLPVTTWMIHSVNSK